jgi:hypothetical protein
MSTPTAPPRPPLTPPPAAPAPHDGGPSVGRMVLGAALVLLGLAWLAEVTGVIAVHWQTVLAVAVLGVGVALLALARSRHTDGLIALGIVLSVGLLVVGLLPTPTIGSGVGDRLHRPTTMAELQERYELGVGNLVLDLRDLELPPGTTAIEVEVGMGELTVRLPSDAGVDVSASAGAGDLEVLGRTSDGFGPTLSHSEPGGDARLALDLSTGMGSIEVTR